MGNSISQFQSNVRAPFALTQALLPLLKVGPGQIVFINSSVGLKGSGGGESIRSDKARLEGLGR